MHTTAINGRIKVVGFIIPAINEVRIRHFRNFNNIRTVLKDFVATVIPLRSIRLDFWVENSFLLISRDIVDVQVPTVGIDVVIYSFEDIAVGVIFGRPVSFINEVL